MKGVPGGNLCLPEVNALTDIVGMGAQQVAIFSESESEFIDRYLWPKTGTASC